MIWHFFEVWLLFLIVFAVGCWLGVLLYGAFARGRLAAAQGAVADFVGDGFDEIKWRLGVGPDWRPAFRASVERDDQVSTRQDYDTGESAQAVAGDLHDFGEARSDGAFPEEEFEVAPTEAEEIAADDMPTSGDDTMMRPAVLIAPRAGVPDNLRRIRGIGKRNEELLHGLGIFHFGQIAAWTPAEVRWVASHLAFPDSIEHDDWIGQAIVLASGGDTGYVDAAERKRRAAAEES